MDILMDLGNPLVEIGFIVNSVSSYGLHCSVQLTLGTRYKMLLRPSSGSHCVFLKSFDEINQSEAADAMQRTNLMKHLIGIG
ncbi:hypothetical protein OUZ56_026489 [Daphnia magna]|uniref:Uncharacterized protein n=1 Tax=Daphnia magna TaxID=35525 RepID=A0ABQ9ZLZ3_9CRUS|nr:hypothetical protein OUZ56_026489 [Daphnia magna]